MRRVILAVAGLVLASASVSAQTPVSALGYRTVAPHQVFCTDQPVATLPPTSLLVVGGHTTDGRASLATGDQLVIGGGSAAGISVGQRFAVRRIEGSLKEFPKKGQGFGAIRTAGVVTVTAVDADTAIARIEFSCDSIAPGDYLEPYVEPMLPSAASAMAAPQFSDRAKVMFGVDRRASLADGDVVSIDRGTAQGVTTGARFAIYRDHHDGLPLVEIGEAVVVEVLEDTSKVVLVSARDAIAEGDVAVPRRTAP